MKTFISLMFGFFVVLAMAVPAEAQYNSRGGYGGGYGQRRPIPGGWGGGGYGYSSYYDPAYLQQMLSLPDGLAACTVDLSTAKVTSCHPVIKDIQVVEIHARDHADRGEMLGTVHVEKGKFHFRPFDDTNGRLGTMSAGALGAGAGAMIGYGSTQNMRNRGKSNVIGASATIGGGLLAGWMASRHTHNNCLKIEPTVARSISTEVQSPAPSQEQGIGQPVAPVQVSEKKLVRNRFEKATVRVWSSSEKLAELPAGSDSFVEVADPNLIWGEANLENPKNGKMEWVPLQIGSGIDNLPQKSGWVFGNPNTRPTL